MESAVLSVEGAAKNFGGVKALVRAGLTLFPHEIHALLGENGAGKSTLLKTLAGLGLPSEMAPYIEDGTVEKVGLWNPIDLGYVAVYAAGYAKAGSFKGTVGSSFTAGKTTYKVTAGGITYLGEPFTFTKANIATFKKIY